MKLPKVNVHIDFRKLGRILKRHLPTILTVSGCIGVPLTAFLSSKATLKAKTILDDQPEDSTFKDDFKAVAKEYIPAVVSGIATMGSIVGSNCINLKRNAALTAAGVAMAKYVMDLRQSIANQYGEETLNKIDAQNAEKKLKGMDFPKELEDDEYVLFEPLTETIFVTSDRKLNDAERILNYDLHRLGSVSVNEFLILACGEPSDSPYGDFVGWSLENNIQCELWYGWQGFEWIDWTILDLPQDIGMIKTVHFNTEPLPFNGKCDEKSIKEIFGEGLQEAMYDY